ncbi:hypothetical protein CDD82_4923 [Ophiocordyceps australis]|uniref:Uncharacterized protein n=1 Tax=Ophiocordyceps australis TaxID=1399860 RepID=A0A2C5YXE1_9HYPO|nr:hypothetical protein CDD82_4923 [Ophiocordyceps australis]
MWRMQRRVLGKAWDATQQQRRSWATSSQSRQSQNESLQSGPSSEHAQLGSDPRQSRIESHQDKPIVTNPKKDKERVVILGSGWAGYALARTLSPAKTSRVLISPRSHFVFTPLLASTAVGTLEFRAALEPVRRLGLTHYHQGWAAGVDFARKVVRVEANTHGDANARTGAPAEHGAEFDVEYDRLVLAMGCYSQTFGIEGVKEHACFLRDVGDARAIRLRVLDVFEKAQLPTTSPADRRRLLHFAIVGGGPTGIEFAAELHDLVHHDLSRLYPDLVKDVAITIYDIAPKVLPMFDQNLATYATDMFRRQGIRVKTEHHLERIRRQDDTLWLRIREEPAETPAGLVVWSTGLMQNPLTEKLTSNTFSLGSASPPQQIARHPRTHGILVDSHMRVLVAPVSSSSSSSSPSTPQPLPGVYAIGDCCSIQDQSLPATAQVASQQAVYLARQLNAGHAAPKPFKFKNLGTMAYLGSSRAIHQSKADELKGRAAWILWRTAYVTRSMSLRNKVMIPIYWFITWVFGRDISRF